MIKKDNAKFDELSEDISEFFMKRYNLLSIPLTINFVFQFVSKQKLLIKLSKIPDQYVFSFKKHILVQINEDYYYSFDEKTNKILFDNALDKVEWNLDKGTFKIGAPNFKTNAGFIEKLGYKNVQDALELERLFEDQKVDKENDKK